MNNIKERIKIFSGAQLKYIAFLSMLIDHTNKALIYPNLDGGALNRLSDFFDILGRIAFPIFIFLLVEGYFHTKNKWKYLITLLVFGVISEIPFDLAASNCWFYLGYQNVFFEFLIGLTVLWGMEQAVIFGKTPLTVEAGKIFAVALGCMAAVFIQADYDYIGIIIIAAFYEFHASRAGRSLSAAVLGGLETLDLNFGIGALAAIPIWFYNGKRGNQRFKYLFYWFYPVHLMILVVVRSVTLGIVPQ